MYRVLDVKHNSVSGTRARCQPDCRVRGDVVALVGIGRLLRALLAMGTAAIQAVDRASAGIDKYAWTRNHLRVLRRSYWDLDHVDAKQRRIRIFVRLFPRAPG